MPRRSQLLINDEIYHVYNRSVGSEQQFIQKRELDRALELIDYYRFSQRLRYSQFKILPKESKPEYISSFKKQKPLIEIYSFALMPNHYHFLLKQMRDNGIVSFIANFQNSYAKYFNIKNNRHGTLFQNSFKAKRVETDEEFTHISRYIHLNPVTSYLVTLDQMKTYWYNSFSSYVNKYNKDFINTELQLEMFKTKGKYMKFIYDRVDYQRKLQEIRHLIIES